MPKYSTTANDFLTKFVRPFAEFAGVLPAYETFKLAVPPALALLGKDMDDKIEFIIPDPFLDAGSGGGEVTLPAPPPGLAPIDPTEVLTAIAAAMGEAEKILNAENLAIGGATAEVNVVVSIGGLAGANANLKINLGPTPRG
jgi:hypothetical protein